jgi:hypothetical protein
MDCRACSTSWGWFSREWCRSCTFDRINLDGLLVNGTMTSAYSQQCCPFCGVVSDAPHETQEACIQALQGEIARMRELLESARSPWTPEPAAEGPDRS